MIPLKDKIPNELLDHVPDFSSWEDACRWINEGENIIQQLTPEVIATSEYTSLEWSEITQKSIYPLGLYGCPNWRKFTLATFLADLISYRQPVDQVTFDRLLFVMHAFPQGFRLWWIKSPNHAWLPVGYSGWYPFSLTMFEHLTHHPETLTSRMIAPEKLNHRPYLYLFNYSAASVLKKSCLTKSLVKQLSNDIQGANAAGLACITVSDEGVNIAKRFGMSLSGYLTIEGCPEGVYVTCSHSSSQSKA